MISSNSPKNTKEEEK